MVRDAADDTPADITMEVHENNPPVDP